jgi:hypothetical protein
VVTNSEVLTMLRSVWQVRTLKTKSVKLFLKKSKAIFRFLSRTLKITVTLHYVTRVITYLTASTEELSVGIVAINAVDQRVDVVLTRHMTDSI